jgi:type IV pilus assembly protein PilM
MGQWTWTKRQIGPIGLDIGHDSIKMLQLSADGRGLSVHRLQKRRFPASGDEETQRHDLILTIRRMLEEGDFHGTEAALCLANDKLKVTSIRLVESDVATTTAQLYKEAALRFGLDPGRDPIQYIPAGMVHQGDQIRHEVILFAADRAATEESLALLDAARLTAVGLEPVPCALARGYERTSRRDEDRTGTLVFVDVGSHHTTVVFSRGGEICFVKLIQAGMECFDQAIAEKLGVAPAEAVTLRSTWQAEEAESRGTAQIPSLDGELEADGPTYFLSRARKPLDPSVHRTLTDCMRSVADAMAREVSLCARYYTVTFRGHRIERVLVSGGGGYEPLLLAGIQAQVGSDVEPARPLRGMGGCADRANDPSRGGGLEWALALGLAFKGWSACSLPEPSENRRRSLVPAV